jgi:hypothetical protein
MVDRGFDQLGIIWLLDVVGTHTLQYFPEELELGVKFRVNRIVSRAARYAHLRRTGKQGYYENYPRRGF